MTEIMPVPRILILLSYQQGAMALFFSLQLFAQLFSPRSKATTTRRLGSVPTE